MTTVEARVLEMDAVIFTNDSERDDSKDILIEERSNDIKLDGATNKINIETRFARLKKSLRKKSVSIL